MAWKPTDIADQTGRTFVITGANGGLGAETTKALAGKGATVIMACRNAAKAQPIADAIPGDVRVAALDLADLASVRAFADQQGEFDVLINNAGLMNIPFSRTADGFATGAQSAEAILDSSGNAGQGSYPYDVERDRAENGEHRRAERMDRLDLQPAGRFQCVGKQCARTRQNVWLRLC